MSGSDTAPVAARAAVLDGPSAIRVAEISVPPPLERQVRVRLEGCGVCGSNLPVWEGRPWFRYPLAPGSPGHEGWGVIDAVGPGVEAVSVGDRVAVLSQNAYAEYDLAAADAVVKLPDALAHRPFPGEALGCAMNILQRSDIAPGQPVAIVGIGFLGAALTALATSAGACVTALSRREFALEMARRCGAVACIRIDEPAAAARQARALAPEGYARVIEAAGSQQALDLAGELAGTRARLVIAGYHQDGPRRIDLQRWNWLGLDVINAHERDPARYRRGIEAAVQAVASGALDPEPLYTHTVALGDIAHAFELLAHRPCGFLKALVHCG